MRVSAHAIHRLRERFPPFRRLPWKDCESALLCVAALGKRPDSKRIAKAFGHRPQAFDVRRLTLDEHDITIVIDPFSEVITTTLTTAHWRGQLRAWAKGMRLRGGEERHV